MGVTVNVSDEADGLKLAGKAVRWMTATKRTAADFRN
jgi:hypothetical protein